MKFYYGVNPLEKREKLLKSDVAKPFIDELIASADEAAESEEFAFKMSEYALFTETGSREIFEKKYFSRRRKCSNLFMAYWITEDEKYLSPLIDHIMYICDEFTWCIPAHLDLYGSAAKEAIEWIDLFQSETARLFSEIVMCVGEKLPEYVLSRMSYEVNRRIFPTLDLAGNEPKYRYWWENCKMNWATVCGAGCAMAALYFAEEDKKDGYIKRLTRCLDSYLEGINDDGCCLEGMSYWNYGFVHFIVLATAVKVYSDGEIDYFKNPKVRALSLFPQKVRMSKTKMVSFSDGAELFKFKIGLLSLLKNEYEDVILPGLENGTRGGNIDSVCELLWFDENYKSEDMSVSTSYFADSQWFVKRCERYSFAAKGGHNNEPHNHNDIGSFMIISGEKTFISDLGCGEYVKDTFKPETRYDFLQNSSRGHSVPVVNGEFQMTGAEFSAKNVSATEKSFELQIEGAYKKGLISTLKRSFEFDENKVTLTDIIQADEACIRERFVSKIEPKVCEGYIDFGVGRILYDEKKYIPDISVDSYNAPGSGEKTDVYLVDFSAVCKSEKVFEFEFVF